MTDLPALERGLTAIGAAQPQSHDYSKLPSDWEQELGRAALRAPKLVNRLYGQVGVSNIYPPRNAVFRSFHETPFHQVRVVVLGQDPYYDAPGKADGLAFSISSGSPKDSLLEVLESLEADIPGNPVPQRGDLSPWARRGVLLANAALTVPAGRPGQHLRAWSGFTRAVLSAVNSKTAPVAFLLWGGKAIGRGRRLPIDLSRHHVIEAAHPRKGAKLDGKSFAQYEVFREVDRWLSSQPGGRIDWSLQ